ncbi:hypothetical protein ACFV9C_18130 [Kribbella sp. NPDC059898]|uniref:hypothetical protein n=1 Tax=Kribbella sp. NPDC059898 TaxID=3346995 RepID=UPI0036667D15
MNAMPATATRRLPWQHPRRRQIAAGFGILLLAYAVLFVIALLGGPRIGASFLPLPGGGPDPAAPVAGLQPGQPTQNVAVPHQTTSSPTTTPAATPTAVPTPLLTATDPPEIVRSAGSTFTPYPTRPGETPTPEIVESTGPTHPPVTERPPTAPTTTDPTTDPTTARPTVPPTTDPTTSPTARPTTPTTSPTTPDDPGKPGSIGGFLGKLLHKLGL